MNSPGLWQALLHLLYVLPPLRTQYRMVGSRQRTDSKMDVINRISEMHTKDYGRMKLRNDLKIKESETLLMIDINSHTIMVESFEKSCWKENHYLSEIKP